LITYFIFGSCNSSLIKPAFFYSFKWCETVD
jgi:hypothetical protein